MRRIDSQSIGIVQGELLLFSDVEEGGVMWTGTGARELRREVAFDTPFDALPAVTAHLTMWDVDRAGNARLDLRVEDITATGFTLVFRTWGDSRVARARASWMAIGGAGHPDNWQID